MSKKLYIFLFLSLITLGSAHAEEQKITLSTYYPAPFGAYDRIRLVPRNPNTISCNSLKDVGTLFVREGDNALLFCGTPQGVIEWGDSSPWVQNGNNLYTGAYANNRLKVGVGTKNPSEKLHIVGNDTSGSRVKIEGPTPTIDLFDNTAATAAGKSAFRFVVDNDRLQIQHDPNNNGLFTPTTPPTLADITITEKGKIGIGITDPWGQVDIQSLPSKNSFIALFGGDSVQYPSPGIELHAKPNPGGDDVTPYIDFLMSDTPREPGTPNDRDDYDARILYFDKKDDMIVESNHFKSIQRIKDTGSNYSNAKIGLFVNNDTQQVGIGTSDPKGALDIRSTKYAFLPPRMNTADRNAISPKPAGATIYNTSTKKIETWTGSAWTSSGATEMGVLDLSGKDFLDVTFTDHYDTPPLISLTTEFDTNSQPNIAGARANILSRTKTGFRVDADIVNTAGAEVPGAVPPGFKVHYVVFSLD